VTDPSSNHGVLFDQPGLARATFGSSDAPGQASRSTLAICYLPGE
jgi:hypothetical protein